MLSTITMNPDITSNKSPSSVTFGVVQVREFERVVGDHPCVSDQGPPLSIGWAYFDHGIQTPVDSFEMTHGPWPRNKRDPYLPLNGTARRIILHDFFGVSKGEISQAQIEVQRTKKQRDETIQNQGKFVEKVHDVVQTARRRIRLRRRTASPPVA